MWKLACKFVPISVGTVILTSGLFVGVYCISRGYVGMDIDQSVLTANEEHEVRGIIESLPVGTTVLPRDDGDNWFGRRSVSVPPRLESLYGSKRFGMLRLFLSIVENGPSKQVYRTAVYFLALEHSPYDMWYVDMPMEDVARMWSADSEDRLLLKRRIEQALKERK